MNLNGVADPNIWSESGGLIGLIIFALFLALAIFIWAQVRIYDMHTAHLRMIMDAHASERRQWETKSTILQKETNEAIRALTVAIHEIASRSRRYDGPGMP